MKRGFIALVMFCVGLYVLKSGVNDIWVAGHSRNCPATPGTISSSAAERQLDMDSFHAFFGYYWASIYYKYSVGGAQLLGNSLYYDSQSHYTNYPAAKGTVDRYPRGLAVTVYYDPNNPKRAVLDPGIKTQHLLPIGAGLIMMIIGPFVAKFGRENATGAIEL